MAKLRKIESYAERVERQAREVAVAFRNWANDGSEEEETYDGPRYGQFITAMENLERTLNLNVQ